VFHVKRLVMALSLLLAAGTAGAAEIPVANAYSAGAWTIEGRTALTGAGGVVASSLSVARDGRLELDPIKTPVKVNGAVTLGVGSKLALAAAYKNCSRGKFTLLTCSGSFTVNGVTMPVSEQSIAGIFDELSVGSAATVRLVTAPDGSNRQLILTVGDYEENAPLVKVMPLGDSITEGTLQYSFYARPNYRLALMAKLEAAGFKAQAMGYHGSLNLNSAGIVAPKAHQLHTSLSGEMCRTSNGVSGLEDSIDVALDIAGEPDFVTFKIGTNDLGGGGQTPDSCFAAWSNVVWKILRARPNTKVIVTTIVNQVGSEKNAAYNEKIRAYVAREQLAAGDEGFPTNRVFFVDICSLLSEAADFADNTHPSWIGHDKVSSCFFNAITNARVRTQGVLPVPMVYTMTSGVEANVPEAYRHNYRRVGRIAITPDVKLANLNYSHFDSALATEQYERVAYYLELKRGNTDLVDYHGHRRFVWADMDAFGSADWNAVQFPKTATQQRLVANLHVYSNDTGVRKIPADLAGAEGFIEFWPFSYSGVASGIAGAPTKLMGTDWNDTASTSGGYGSFQIHRKFRSGESWNAGEVLMAFNRWNTTGSNEIGIGSLAQRVKTKSIDYTYTADWAQVSSTAYEEMFLEIWVKPKVREVVEFGNIAVEDGYDYTNAVVSVGVAELNPNAQGAKLVVTVRSATGEVVAVQERAISAVGECRFDFGGLLPGGNYVFEVTATNDTPLAARAVDAVRLLNLGHLATSNAWFKADADEVVNGAWKTEPVYANGRAEVGENAGLGFGIDRKADAGKCTVLESVVEFSSPVPAASLAALDLSDCQSAITPLAKNWQAWNGVQWIALSGRQATPGRWTVRSTYDYAGASPRVAYAVKREGDSGFTQLRAADGVCWFACGKGMDAKRLSGVDYRCGGRFVAHRGDYHEATTASAANLASGTKANPVRLHTNVTWNEVKSGTYFIDRNGHTLKLPPKAYAVYGPGNQVTIRLGDGLVIYFAGTPTPTRQ